MMHYARLDHSPRLQRFLKLLQDGKRHSTMDVISCARICAVNSAAAELRANGIDVECNFRGLTDTGERVYEYHLPSSAE